MGLDSGQIDLTVYLQGGFNAVGEHAICF